MPSPFPGMNPYLEQADVWNDLHQSLTFLIRQALTGQVEPNYIVKLEEQLYIHEPSAETRRLFGRADVSVGPSAESAPKRPGAGVLEAPARVKLPVVDVERMSRVEVRDRRSRQLVTVIEVLSPSNKYAGPDRDQYVAKRQELIASQVHLVEIDLLRGGPRMPIDDLPECDYCVVVSRYEERPSAELWPVRLRETLPKIPVPLRAPDPDAQVDLQALLHQAYDAARYGTYIYLGKPEPALSPEDAAWAEQLIPQKP
jgi:hypothetical protein